MNKRTITIILMAILLSIVFSGVVNAYGIPSEFKPENTPMDLGQDGFKDSTSATRILLQIIANGLLYFAAPIGIITIVISAFTITMSGADSEALEQGKKHLTWSIIGLLTIILSYSLVRYVIDFILIAAAPAA